MQYFSAALHWQGRAACTTPAPTRTCGTTSSPSFLRPVKLDREAPSFLKDEPTAPVAVCTCKRQAGRQAGGMGAVAMSMLPPSGGQAAVHGKCGRRSGAEAAAEGRWCGLQVGGHGLSEGQMQGQSRKEVAAAWSCLVLEALDLRRRQPGGNGGAAAAGCHAVPPALQRATIACLTSQPASDLYTSNANQ